MKDKFIIQYIGGRQLLKRVRTLDRMKQMNDASLIDFYTRFNMELSRIDQLITRGGTIRDFVRALGPKGSTLYNSMSVIPVNTVDEMAACAKSYIDLEIAKEGRNAYKEASKKEIQEGKI